MNYVSLVKRGRLIVAIVGLLCVALAGALVWRTAAIRRSHASESQRKYNARVRDGVGSEVQFADSGDEGNCRASADSVSHFIFKRSGAILHGKTKTRLARMEASTLAGNNRRISLDQLSEVLAQTAIERISKLSDSDINHASESLRGFDAPDLPDSFRRGRNTVKLRASKGSSLTPEQFVAQAKAIRSADDASKNIFQAAAKTAIVDELGKRSRSLGDAVPERFGSSGGLTPIQVVLLAYSIVADDPLTDSEANSQNHMVEVRDGMTRITGQTYASPDGHLAYGNNGYLFSTPLDLAFDDETVNLLLDHIAERSANQ
ncbi:MAG: hypothetical protein DMF72_21195 [Acidobacteria bacterium]|nr:MAG: hypothetical protein DMF72_21195 [Acidobacteriota bacterium]